MWWLLFSHILASLHRWSVGRSLHGVEMSAGLFEGSLGWKCVFCFVGSEG